MIGVQHDAKVAGANQVYVDDLQHFGQMGGRRVLDPVCLADRLARKEEEVVLPLVIPLAVKVLDIRAQRGA